MVRPAAKREAVAHLRNVLQMSERRGVPGDLSGPDPDALLHT